MNPGIGPLFPAGADASSAASAGSACLRVAPRRHPALGLALLLRRFVGPVSVEARSDLSWPIAVFAHAAVFVAQVAAHLLNLLAQLAQQFVRARVWFAGLGSQREGGGEQQERDDSKQCSHAENQVWKRLA